MSNIIKAAFQINGFSCHPEKISEILKIEPTKSWRKGDLVGKSALVRIESGWSLSIDNANDKELEDIVSELLSMIYDKKEQINKIDCKKTISCLIEIYEREIPAIYFGEILLSKISDLGASIDIDMYFFVY